MTITTAEGPQHGFTHGCPCSDCRTEKNARRRAAYRRKAYGQTAPTDLIPVEAAAADLAVLRENYTWEQIETLTKTSRHVLYRLLAEDRRMVSVSVAERLAAARAAIPRLGSDFTGNLVEADFTRWMIRALYARGHSERWLRGALGGTALPTHSYPKVHINTQAKVRAIFDEYHEAWGPSRIGARRLWRQGHFLSECYEWEYGDFRPIPGSFDPELVREAITFTPPNRTRTTTMQARLVRLGQYAKPECADTVRSIWEVSEGRGEGVEISQGCAGHRHRLPDVWLTDV